MRIESGPVDVVCLHAKDEIERFCRGNPRLHLYALGDLDDFFWPYTNWYAVRDGEQIRQLALIYTGCTMPVVLAYAEEPVGLMHDLLRGLLPILPRRFYAHLTMSADVLADDYRIQSHGLFHKMGLSNRALLEAVDAAEAVPLSAADGDELRALYDASYPGHWFMPRMLDTGFYFGI